MKELTDTSLFNREESAFLYQIGKSVVWENRSTFQYESFGLSYDPSLAITLFVKSLCSKQTYYTHRTHQLPVTFDYVVSGSIYFRSGNKVILAEAGDIVILPQGGNNAILYLPSLGPCERYGMIIEGLLFNTLVKFFKLDGFICISAPSPQMMISIFEKLRNSLKNGSSQEHIASELYEFLCILGKFYSHNAQPPLLAEIVNYLDLNITKKIQINKVAELFHISVQGLNNLFKKHLQTTAYQYVVSQRMTRAKELLSRAENYRINEIAFLCGYENPLHFSTDFRQHFGKSPRNFRKK